MSLRHLILSGAALALLCVAPARAQWQYGPSARGMYQPFVAGYDSGFQTGYLRGYSLGANSPWNRVSSTDRFSHPGVGWVNSDPFSRGYFRGFQNGMGTGYQEGRAAALYGLYPDYEP